MSMIRFRGIVMLVLCAVVAGGAVFAAPAPAPTAGSSLDPEFAKGKSAEEIAWYERIGNAKLVKHPSLVYVKDVAGLPRVLLIGDSISMGYTLPVRKMLEGKANVHRIPGNGGESGRGVKSLDAWLAPGGWDVIHFNFGIHDLKRIKDGKWDIEGKPVSNPELYEKNLRELATRLKATGAELVFATTTQIPAGAAGVPERGEVELNAIAERVMREAGIVVNDLHAHLAKELKKYQKEANVHFDPEGYTYLGEVVSAHIEQAIARREAARQAARRAAGK